MTRQAVKLTTRVVKSTSPTRSKFVLWDSEIPAFGLRVMPSGSKAFILRYRIGKGRRAKERMITLGKVGEITCEGARRLARDYKAEARLGLDPEQERRQELAEGMTFSDLFESWKLNAVHINRRTGAERKPENIKLDIDRIGIHVVPIIGDAQLTELKKADIAFVRDEISRGVTSVRKKTKPRGVRMATGGTGTAARTIATLSSVFSYAMDEEWIDKNPCRGVKVRPDQKCERFLSEAEAGRLGEVLKEWDTDGAAKTAVAIIRLLSLTGARRSEITNLKWSEIDFDQGFFRLGDSKTGHSIRPLSSMALNVLQALPREHPNWVFPSATGDSPFQGIGKLWRKIRTDADLEDVRLHDLRHSFASFGAANGLSLPMIGALLGHRNYSTTQRYAHLTNHAAREAADSIAEVVGSAFKL